MKFWNAGDRGRVVADLALALRRFVGARFRVRSAGAAAAAAGAGCAPRRRRGGRAVPRRRRAAARSASCACRDRRTCRAGAWRPIWTSLPSTSIWPRSCVISWRRRSSCCDELQRGIRGRTGSSSESSMRASCCGSAHRCASPAPRSACARCRRRRTAARDRQGNDRTEPAAQDARQRRKALPPPASRVTRHRAHGLIRPDRRCRRGGSATSRTPPASVQRGFSSPKLTVSIWSALAPEQLHHLLHRVGAALAEREVVLAAAAVVGVALDAHLRGRVLLQVAGMRRHERLELVLDEVASRSRRRCCAWTGCCSGPSARLPPQPACPRAAWWWRRSDRA